MLASGLQKSPTSMSLEQHNQQQNNFQFQENRQPPARKITLRNFLRHTKQSPLGHGHFGKVWLVIYQSHYEMLSEDSPLLPYNEVYNDESQLQLLKQKSSMSSINSHSQRSLANLGGQDHQGAVQSILPLTAPQDMYALKMVELQ